MYVFTFFFFLSSSFSSLSCFIFTNGPAGFLRHIVLFKEGRNNIIKEKQSTNFKSNAEESLPKNSHEVKGKS